MNYILPILTVTMLFQSCRTTLDDITIYDQTTNTDISVMDCKIKEVDRALQLASPYMDRLKAPPWELADPYDHIVFKKGKWYYITNASNLGYLKRRSKRIRKRDLKDKNGNPTGWDYNPEDFESDWDLIMKGAIKVHSKSWKVKLPPYIDRID